MESKWNDELLVGAVASLPSIVSVSECVHIGTGIILLQIGEEVSLD